MRAKHADHNFRGNGLSVSLTTVARSLDANVQTLKRISEEYVRRNNVSTERNKSRPRYWFRVTGMRFKFAARNRKSCAVSHSVDSLPFSRETGPRCTSPVYLWRVRPAAAVQIRYREKEEMVKRMERKCEAVSALTKGPVRFLPKVSEAKEFP